MTRKRLHIHERIALRETYGEKNVTYLKQKTKNKKQKSNIEYPIREVDTASKSWAKTTPVHQE